jgi:hypothetical protein
MMRYWAIRSAAAALGCGMICLFSMIGCVPRIKPLHVSVNSFAAPHAGSYHRYVVLPLNDGVQESDLEFQEYSGYLHKMLQARGFRPAKSPEEAELAIFFGYGIGQPEERTYSYNVPVWGQTGVASSTTTGEITSYGNTATVASRTNYTPQYGVTGYRTETGSITTFNRYAIVNAVDVERYRQDQRVVEVWTTRMTSVGVSGDLRTVLPVMLAGARDLLGVSTGTVVQRQVDLEGPDVVWIRGGQPITVHQR